MKRFRKNITRFAVLAALLLFAAAAENGSAQTKAALVIGNENYRELSRLNNPVNDARDMADSLRNLGFFFYAGHGVQSGGANYLIPADAQIPGEAFLRSKALSVQSLLDTIGMSGNKLNVVVLDACRDNPYSWGRSGSRGLTVVGRQPAGSIIAYATSAGSVAQDGRGRNGVFTSELLKNLKTPGLDIFDVFRETGAAVRNASCLHPVLVSDIRRIGLSHQYWDYE